MADLSCEKAGFDLYGCALHMKDGRRWVNLPQRPYQDKETGETKYANTVKIPNQDHYKAFQHMAREAIDKWIAENQPTRNNHYFTTQTKAEELPF